MMPKTRFIFSFLKVSIKKLGQTNFFPMLIFLVGIHVVGKNDHLKNATN